MRINYSGAFYHVTSQGNERKNVFKSKRDREKFIEGRQGGPVLILHSPLNSVKNEDLTPMGWLMPKYLFHGSYTLEGYKGLMEEGGSRRIEAAKQALGSVGGSLEAFYFSFGENDFYIIVDLPDNVSTTAVTLAGNITGTLSINGVALLTPEELDEAIKMSVDFRPPGQ